jgi:hypothetical protein
MHPPANFMNNMIPSDMQEQINLDEEVHAGGVIA